jgi:two-component sensor histidine kinase
MADAAGDDTADLCRDPERLAAFAPYEILDTPREAEYDDLVRLAAQICKVPIAVINLVLADRQWFKAEVGLGVRETGLAVSICRHLLLTPGLTVIPDTRQDPRLAANPLVASEPGLRFYAGHLLATPAGAPLGTTCVLDHHPRSDLDAEQRFALAALARQLTTQLELRRALREQRRLIEQKDLLFQELNHRVKNRLQIIAGLIQLQSASVRDGGDARALLAETRGRVLTVATLHEHLYRSGDLREVELGRYLRTLLPAMAPPAGEGAAVELRVGAGEAPLPVDRAVLVAMAVNELVTNAVKHARRGGRPGRVLVCVVVGEGAAHRVSVEDDGPGLSAGFDPDAASGLGMRIVAGLARQLDASLTWGDAAGGGARFRLDLPPARG